jgi:hypothetical protein
MSNHLAIAAVTATLGNLLQNGLNLDPDLGGASVTTRPPDKARASDDNGKQINLFLYQTAPNAAWRNKDMPRQVKPGEQGHPPLALNLYYLLTAYGKDNEDVSAHHLLGRAMSILHDHPLLTKAEILGAMADSDLGDQIDRVRITAQPISLEEISKLWTTFQTSYRISAGYQASVVLIDSTLAVKSAPPVLRRGSDDRGPVALASPSPALSAALPPGAQPSVRLGEELLLEGRSLDAGGLSALLASALLPSPVKLLPEPGGTADQLRLRLLGPADDADALSRWAPGFYTLGLLVEPPGLTAWTTNEVPFSLAPTITVAPLTANPGDVAVTVTCAPRLRPGQRVLLLFGDRQVTPQSVVTPADPALPSTLQFLVTGVPVPQSDPDKYLVRLRVDGVDSLPAVLAGTPPVLQFDPTQIVTVEKP